MKDNYDLIKKFVKIVERHPEIYDRNLDAYKTRNVDPVWEKVASSVRSEIGEECTVEELKMKWKGIRSSYSRYKSKLIQSQNDPSVCKKYYLYDALSFLDPFTLCKSVTLEHQDRVYEESNTFVSVDENEVSSDYNGFIEWEPSDTKPDILHRTDKDSGVDTLEKISNHGASIMESNCSSGRKRKFSHVDKDTDDDHNEDLHFFRSILPDIKDFTNKEKRKLKMGILQLIDDLENERNGE